MQRREFHQAAVSAAVLSLFGLAGCGGGGGSSEGTGSVPGPGSGGVGPAPAPGPAAPAPQPPASRLLPMGTNLSGMEWAQSGLRTGPNTAPNVHFTVPRSVDVAYLARTGFGRNRLPIQWELLQPMLVDTPANAQARALIGEPGALNAAYAGYITGVLDAHAAVGAHCIIDLHNYCRYRDFRFQPDGSVIGLTRPADPLLHAYTTDPSQVWTRIFATAPGASIRPAAFADVWARMAARWKDHPGFGGYGLMNEPYDLPRPGGTTETTDGSEDLMIWPTFARAAIDAIRAIDGAGTIYLAGNAFGGAMNIGPRYNPAWPLPGANIVYEVHSYLDAWNSGTGFDWEVEQQKDYVAGFGPGRVTLDTGADRMRIATDWARANGTRVALTETAMPVDDPRWAEAFRRLMVHSWENGVEVQSWMGGSHWPIRAYAINHVPGWHQNRTLHPQVAGVMQHAAGLPLATLFDDGGGWSAGGSSVTVTVYARGNLAAPVALTVASDGGGTFSKNRLVIPAGPNGQDSFTFTPARNRVTTLSYTSDGQLGGQVPPPRRVYSLADPVAHAATSLAEAALAIIARYSAARWDMADGYTDFLQGRPAAPGQQVRAVADTGWASSPGNAMEMVNAFNQDGPNMGPLVPPVMRDAGGRRHTDHSAPGCTGLWCKKVLPTEAEPRPRNRVAYDLQDPHFVVVALHTPAAGRDGVLFQASNPQTAWYSELAFAGGQPQARWLDVNGQALVLGSSSALASGAPAVLALRSAPGAQQFRVNGAAVATGATSFAPSPFAQFLVGWGFTREVPAPSFGGSVYLVITGRGNPSAAELAVLERYAAAAAGIG